ncbi:autophagy-related protein [Kalaharituber pfeilii]|nr:autophagy-related protein [Kalaharituber pfeilii]
MEKPQVFTLDLYADQSLGKDIVRGILSTIFFHRIFPPIKPTTRDLLDLTLPYVDDPELLTQIEEKATTLIRSIENTGSSTSTGQLAVQFFERRTPAKRINIWFAPKAEQEVCWEQWIIKVTLVTPRTDSDRVRIRQAMESNLQKAVMQIITNTTCHRDHIPPIITSEKNPFPYHIVVQPKGDTWSGRMGIIPNWASS